VDAARSVAAHVASNGPLVFNCEYQAYGIDIRHAEPVKRVERVRLYPTKRQQERLHFMLDVTRELYNALLQERRDAYRSRRVCVTTKQQYAELTSLRKPAHAIDGRLAAVYRECEDAVLHRLDLGSRRSFAE
jgi:putative transposase